MQDLYVVTTNVKMAVGMADLVCDMIDEKRYSFRENKVFLWKM